MFLDNDYTKEYYQLIEEAKLKERSKKEDTYYENHHIIPRSIGGQDSKENLILLTGREHFLAHKLLPFCVEDSHKNSLVIAWHMMSNRNNKPIDYEEYAYLKEEYSKIVSTRMSNMVGEKNNFYGREHTVESKRKQADAQLGKKLLEETKKAIGDYQKGRKKSKETRNKMSEAQSGKNNPMYGKKHTPEDCKKIAAARLGKKWIHNPTTEEKKLIEPNEALPNGFISGKGPNKTKKERND